MKTFLMLVAAFVLAAGVSGEASAAKAKKKRLHVSQYSVASGNPMAANGYTGYYERVLDKVPYGSQLWWRVYDSMPKGR